MPAVPAWLPNAISYLRIALVPVWVGLAEAANRAGEAGQMAATPRRWPLLVLLTIGVSDVVDGHLARRFHLQTRVGATLDAVADKLAQVVLFTYLALRPGPAFAAIPIWFLGLLIARDAMMLAGFALVRLRAGSVEVVHRVHGKAASVLLFGLLIVFNFGLGDRVTTSLLLAAATFAVASTALYVREGWRQWSAAAT